MRTEAPLTVLASTADHVVEFDAQPSPLLTIIRRSDGRHLAFTGKRVAGEFRDCLRTHAPERVIATFIRMAGPKTEWLDPVYRAGSTSRAEAA